ncbi:MAG: CPBP family intramembrane glutamic endopeptidase [Pseudomonadota bacterium]|nr:CPBP family intramembrane glutamic endopeptidase [Pseudomonadota bacterium]
MTTQGKFSVGLMDACRQWWQAWIGERSAMQRGGSLVLGWLGFMVLFVLSQAPFALSQTGAWEIHVLVPSAAVDSAKLAVLQAAQSHDLKVRLVVSSAAGDESNRSDPACGGDVSRIGVRVFSSMWALPTSLIWDAPLKAGVRVCGSGYQSPDRVESIALAGVGMATVAVFLAFVILLRNVQRVRESTLLSPLAWAQTARPLRATGWALLAAIIILGAPLLLVWLGVIPFDETSALQSLADLPEARWSLFVSLVVLAPVIEEITFRFWLVSFLEYALGRGLALYGSTVVFVLVHVPDSPLRAVSLTIAGLALGWLWLRLRSLPANIFAHALVNLASFAAIAWANTGNT